MSFLGVGVSATEPSLGRMLSDGQGYLLRGLPWYALCVGMTIVLLILGSPLWGSLVLAALCCALAWFSKNIRALDANNETESNT